jgi:hypothetical protein
MRHSAEFFEKMLSPTLRYATGHEIQVKIFWSTLRYAAFCENLCELKANSKIF